MLGLIFKTDIAMRADLVVMITLAGIYIYLEYRETKRAPVSANTKAQ